MNEIAEPTPTQIFGHVALILTNARFVSERPKNDGSMVFISFIHPLGTVKISLRPRRTVRQAAPSLDSLHTVRFNIGFLAKIKAEAITKARKAGIVGVVAGANHVHVMALEQIQIGQHMIHRRS